MNLAPRIEPMMAVICSQRADTWEWGCHSLVAEPKRPYKVKSEQAAKRSEVVFGIGNPPGNAQHTPGKDYGVFYGMLS